MTRETSRAQRTTPSGPPEGVARISAALMAAVVLTGGCAPETKSFGGAITGTVIAANLQPAGLMAVFTVDGGGGTAPDYGNALTGGNGRFRVEAPAGTWTLVATDFQSQAGFVYEVRVANGATVDLGTVYLQPCARPGSSPNGEVYEECPDPASGLGYGAPDAMQQSIVFAPDYTDATLTEGAPRYADVTSWDGSYQLNLQIPETLFAAGSHAVSEGGDFSSWLLDVDGGVFYTFDSGTLEIEALVPSEGGLFRARLRDATFRWRDPETNTTQSGYTIDVTETSPAMEDTFAIVTSAPPPGLQPTEDYIVARFEPEFTQLYANVDGSLSLGSFQSFPSGEYLEVYLEIPPALAVAGVHVVENGYAGDPSNWSIALSGRANWIDVVGNAYPYVLSRTVLDVSDPAGGPDDTFALTLGDAVFQWQSGPYSPPFTTLTLEITTSGTIATTADPVFDGGLWDIDWNAHKSDMFVNLGG